MYIQREQVHDITVTGDEKQNITIMQIYAIMNFCFIYILSVNKYIICNILPKHFNDI